VGVAVGGDEVGGGGGDWGVGETGGGWGGAAGVWYSGQSSTGCVAAAGSMSAKAPSAHHDSRVKRYARNHLNRADRAQLDDWDK